ncbi:MAG TPA: SLBB domain-containing protein [Anaerolineae bacterium]|nr:SLBB domain-containing protein [Anaerolineae bacterium]
MNSLTTMNTVFLIRHSILLSILSIMLFTGSSSCAQTTDYSSSEEGKIFEEFVSSREMMETYMINSLDRLLIVVYAGEKQIEKYEEYVKSDGNIYFPFLEKDVKIGGLRVLDAEDMLEKLALNYIKEPRVGITVVSSYYQTVSTYGKIASRTVDLKTPIRILQLLARVGGPLEDANVDSIRVISVDGNIRYFNYKEVNKNPTDENNFFLRPGDIVFAPGEEDFSVMVLGDVNKAGTYPMKRGQRLVDAILKAGSWNPSADIKNVRVLTTTQINDVEVKKINLNKIFDRGELELNYALRDGDIVYVPTKRAPVLIQLTASIMQIIYTIVTSYVVYHSLHD